MKLQIKRIDVWAASIEDRPGALAGKLDALAKADANLEFAIARRAPERPGTGVLFVTPVKGSRQLRAARGAGFSKSKSLHGLRIAATNKPGLGAVLTAQIAEAGINLRGLSAAVIGRRAVFHLAFDSDADTGKATRCLRRI